MAEELTDGQSFELRTQLWEILSASEAPQFIDALRRIAAHEADPLKIKAEVLLRAHESRAIVAAEQPN
jgi:hypothetical protein